MILEGSIGQLSGNHMSKVFAWLHPAHLESFLALPPVKKHVDEMVVWDFAGQLATLEVSNCQIQVIWRLAI